MALLGYIYRKAGQDASKSAFNMGTFTITMNFGSTISILNNEGGPLSKHFLRAAFGIFNVDSSQATVFMCLQSYFAQYVLTLWTPIACLVVLAVGGKLDASRARSSGGEGSEVRLSSVRRGAHVRLSGEEEEEEKEDAEDEEQEEEGPAGVDKPPSWFARWLQSTLIVLLYACTSMTKISVSSFVCQPYLDFKVLVSMPAIECGADEHTALLSWSVPFFVVFTVAFPAVLACCMLKLNCVSWINRHIRVLFLQASYKRKSQPDGTVTLKQMMQANYELILLLRRLALTMLTLFSSSDPDCIR
jgi:hypothetical protein